MDLYNHTAMPTVVVRRLVAFAAAHRDFSPLAVEIKPARRNTCTLSKHGGRVTVWLAPDSDLPRVVETAAMAFEALRLRARENDKHRAISSLGGAVARGEVRWEWRASRTAGTRAANDFVADLVVQSEIASMLDTIATKRTERATRKAAATAKARSPEAKAAALRTRIASWTRKRKLADTYLRKYSRALKRLERKTP